MSMASSGTVGDGPAGNTGFICAGGVTYPAQWWLDVGGNLQDIRYIKQNGTIGDPRVDFATWLWGACSIQRHTFTVTQALVAGANVITHNLNLTGKSAVQVRDATSGAEIAVRVTAETANTVTVTVPVAETSVRIVVVAVEA